MMFVLVLQGDGQVSSIPLEQIIHEMGTAVGSDCGLGNTLKFDFGDEGSVLIDGLSQPNTVTDGAGKAASCVIKVSKANFEKMVAGELDGTSAFMMGKLQVSGDMTLAMRIGPILQKARK
jgi:putative sterol carrier protein